MCNTSDRIVVRLSTVSLLPRKAKSDLGFVPGIFVAFPTGNDLKDTQNEKGEEKKCFRKAHAQNALRAKIEIREPTRSIIEEHPPSRIPRPPERTSLIPTIVLPIGSFPFFPRSL